MCLHLVHCVTFTAIAIIAIFTYLASVSFAYCPLLRFRRRYFVISPSPPETAHLEYTSLLGMNCLSALTMMRNAKQRGRIAPNVLLQIISPCSAQTISPFACKLMYTSAGTHRPIRRLTPFALAVPRLLSHAVIVGPGGGSSIARNESAESGPPSRRLSSSSPSPLPHAGLERCVLLAVDCRSRRLRSGPSSSSSALGDGSGGKQRAGPDAAFTFNESIDEMRELVRTAGFEVASLCTQKLQTPNKKTYVGPGKLQELFEAVQAASASVVIVDADLSPRQLRALEAEMAYRCSHQAREQSAGQSRLQAPPRVLDRTSVILDIFAKHARSKEALMQVELATLHYRLAQLSPDEELVVEESEEDKLYEEPQEEHGVHAGVSDKRHIVTQSHTLQTRRVKLGESSGFRGKGETKLELDRREVKDRIALLKAEISGLGSQRAMHREGRQRLGLPMVSLVGYTNAGKSTIFAGLSREAVLCEDKLFATLDPVTRRVKLPVSKLAGKHHGAQEKGVQVPEAIAPNETESFAREGEWNGSDIATTAATTIPSSDSSDRGSEEGAEACSVPQEATPSLPEQSVLKHRDIFLTDTVGFISKLPANLIASFRATLEQAVDADVILHVIDRSSPSWQKQRDVVRAELAGLYAEPLSMTEARIEHAENGGGNSSSSTSSSSSSSSRNDGSSGSSRTSMGRGSSRYPMVIEVWNKMDKVCNTTAATPESDFEVLSGKVIAESTAAPVHPSLHGLSDDWLAVPAAIVPTSALHRKGIRGLIRCLSSIVAGDLIEATCSFRYDQGPSTGGDGASANGPIDVGKWTGQIYRQGEVVSAEYSDSGVEIRCKLPEALYNKLLRLGVVEFEH